MPSASHWGYFIYVNAAFIIISLLITYYATAVDVKKNWAAYRCNPLYMPMSDNIEQDFQYCIQNSQMSFMGYILQPLTFVTSNLTQNSGAFMQQINDVRAMFDKVRTFLSDIIQNVFGVFLNLIIEFQKVTISIKDLMGKTIGILVTVLYLLSGSQMTMESTWAGPVGQSVKSLGKCFHPHTLISLKDGQRIQMQFLQVGDILENGAEVLDVFFFTNTPNDPNYEPLYELVSTTIGDDPDPIYVTGPHYIYDSSYGGVNNSQGFVQIKDSSYVTTRGLCKKQQEIQSDYLVCINTSNHNIVINDYVFWDYDDEEVQKA